MTAIDPWFIRLEMEAYQYLDSPPLIGIIRWYDDAYLSAGNEFTVTPYTPTYIKINIDNNGFVHLKHGKFEWQPTVLAGISVVKLINASPRFFLTPTKV
jgi:hypothetical protein